MTTILDLVQAHDTYGEVKLVNYVLNPPKTSGQKKKN